MSSLMIQSDAPFKVFCNTCDRWVAGERINIDGTHDADESQPIVTAPRAPRAASTDHRVWDNKPRPRPEAPEQEEPELTYTASTVWGDPMAGTPNVYTYEFSDGAKYVMQEMKNIVSGTFSSSVRRVDGDRAVKVTQRELAARKAAAKRLP